MTPQLWRFGGGLAGQIALLMIVAPLKWADEGSIWTGMGMALAAWMIGAALGAVIGGSR